MTGKAIGVVVPSPNTAAAVQEIQSLEEQGVPAVWLTGGAVGVDALAVLAVAATKTKRIKMGTSIIPTYPRHPLVMVQQTLVIAQLAPGRFRLGVGPSHRPIMEGTYGFTFQEPLGHLREYLSILKALFTTGAVDFKGAHYRANAKIQGPIDVPVMASALRRGSFELCGEVSDGAISWLCPVKYLQDIALPAMRQGAAKAGRQPPPLMAQAALCVHDDPAEVQSAVREQVINPRLPFYQKMFIAAGYPEASSGTWSEAMIDAVVFSGDEQRVAARIKSLLATDAAEALFSIVSAGKDKAASRQRSIRLIAKAANARAKRVCEKAWCGGE
ncbi:MAG: LLM class flavin-dependent oxidoreductase [Chloroflexi bacterium]|nr:LLM class flavin-dependent oxidoreductase [Chloroflexota bacterium]